MKVSQLLVGLVLAVVLGVSSLHLLGRGHGTGRASSAVGAPAVDEAAAAQAGSDIQTTIPAVEAYNADSGGYAGMTSATLRLYDAALPKEVEVFSPSASGYCLQATVRDVTYSENGPGGELVAGRCAAH